MNLQWTGIVFKLLFGNCQRILWWCSWPRWVRHWWGCSQDIIRSWVLSVNEMYLACKIKMNMIVEWKRGWDGSFAIPRDFQNGQPGPIETERPIPAQRKPKRPIAHVLSHLFMWPSHNTSMTHQRSKAEPLIQANTSVTKTPMPACRTIDLGPILRQTAHYGVLRIKSLPIQDDQK